MNIDVTNVNTINKKNSENMKKELEIYKSHSNIT